MARSTRKVLLFQKKISNWVELIVPIIIAHSQGLDTPSSSSKFPTQFVHLPAGKVATPSTIVPHQSLFEASVPFLHNSDILLSIFRDRLTPLMPFVVIPSHITAEDLHRDKPTAYMAIMLASSYRDITMQLDLARLLLKYLATKVVLEGRKSLDILQGLLIHISWFVFSYCGTENIFLICMTVVITFVISITRQIISWDFSTHSSWSLASSGFRHTTMFTNHSLK